MLRLPSDVLYISRVGGTLGGPISCASYILHQHHGINIKHPARPHCDATGHCVYVGALREVLHARNAVLLRGRIVVNNVRNRPPTRLWWCSFCMTVFSLQRRAGEVVLFSVGNLSWDLWPAAYAATIPHSPRSVWVGGCVVVCAQCSCFALTPKWLVHVYLAPIKSFQGCILQKSTWKCHEISTYSIEYWNIAKYNLASQVHL